MVVVLPVRAGNMSRAAGATAGGALVPVEPALPGVRSAAVLAAAAPALVLSSGRAPMPLPEAIETP
ncbi:hypothetical protein, partial [Nocardia cyriacigeorgica]|uniref:hypothetical protein n=1 Tax=Nocardia cyriacigeorgica TaxID=135487 RepID=UPI002453E9E9